MISWLTFRLVGPMASFGEEPGNAARGSAAWPTRSALIGLIGAALGVERSDREGQKALASQYRFVIRADSQGTLLRDFHTYQSLPSAKGKPATRAEALRHPEVVTSITRRDYRSDVAFHIAMRSVEDAARWSLETVAEALKRPVYILCLGRRSCPPGAPLRPQIVTADSGPLAIRTSFGAPETALPHAAETPQDLGPSNRPRRVRRRTDQPLDRITWSFATREEWVEQIA